MDFPFKSCIVADETLSLQVRELLGSPLGMTYILFDLKIFAEEMQKLGEEKVIAHSLASHEQDYLGRMTSAKRKTEWLGGRFAAKYVSAEVLSEHGCNLPWHNQSIVNDENGRPFLAPHKKSTVLPDISISHSRDLAAAMAVSTGLCGIDIQKISPQVIRVRERFCSAAEEQILFSFFRASHDQYAIFLTKLWAAKEAVRKVANTGSLPGFLALELTEITAPVSHKDAALWRFVLQWKHMDLNGNQVSKKCCVAVNLIADYALALTTRNDTVG